MSLVLLWPRKLLLEALLLERMWLKVGRGDPEGAWREVGAQGLLKYEHSRVRSLPFGCWNPLAALSFQGLTINLGSISDK